MKISFFILYTFFCSVCSAQTIYVATNIPGKYRIIVDGSNDATVDLKLDVAYKVELGTLLEVRMDKDDHMIQYRFINPKVKKNDTLKLEFQSFHSVDTTHYTSGCLDGSYPVNEVTQEEFNKGMIEKDALPSQVMVSCGKKRLTVKKGLWPIYEITSGHGTKEGKDWGFRKTTERILVIYQNF